MSEKKVVRRSIAIGLGLLCIILGVTTVMFALNYLPTNSNNRAPKLINVGLGANDLSDEFPYESKIHITGYVVNTGLDPAYTTKLHVVSTLQSGAVAIDDYYEISGGIMSGGEVEPVDMTIPYGGSGVTRTTMTPFWANAP
jgi:hypothetical protein